MTRKAMKEFEEMRARKSKIAAAKIEAKLGSASSTGNTIGGYVVINLKELNALNEKSVEHGYNCNILFDAFAKKFAAGMNLRGMWQGAHTKVILQPMMIHEHKALKPCEPHVRCLIFTDDICGVLTLDVDMNDFKRLLLTNEVYEEGAE